MVHTDVGGPQKMPSLKENASIVHQLTAPYNPQQNGAWKGKIERFWRWQDVFCMKKIYLKNFGLSCKYNSIFAEQISNKSIKEANPFRSLVWVSTWKTWSLHLLSQWGVLNFDLVFAGIWILKLNIAVGVLNKICNIQIFSCFLFGQDLVIWFLFYRKYLFII